MSDYLVKKNPYSFALEALFKLVVLGMTQKCLYAKK